MKKKIFWMVMSGLMGLSLVMAACGPAAPEEKTEVGEKKVIVQAEEEEKAGEDKEEVVEEEVVSSDTPQYGGTLTVSVTGDFRRWDTFDFSTATEILALTNQSIWEGDWTKGPAGGYGTAETDWASNSYDVWDHKVPVVAESVEWTIDEATAQGTIVYQIRPGMHFGLNPDNEASRLVGGREMTVDDVIWSMQHAISTSYSYLNRATPELRVADITKTGPWEITVKVPFDAMMTAIARFGDSIQIQASEIHAKYGDASDGHGQLNTWQPSSIGTGPYVLTDNVPGSNVLLDRNTTYWGTDPIGPGKGNKLPYIDTIRILVIPDVSTQQAALRTGKIDWMLGITWEDAGRMRQTTPELSELAYGGGGGAFWMNSQRAPFDNVLVRRAALMATDLNAINDSLMGGLGQIHTYPWPYLETYKELYLALDDPDFPETAKELYVYNPEKARQNLADAGYPDGFKVDAIITASQVDYFAIIKSMWSKVGIDLQLEVREAGAADALKRAGDYDVGRGGGNIISIFFTPPTLTSTVKSYGNVDDPKLHAGFSEIRKLAITDFKGAMGLARELSKYIIDQVYGIPTPAAPSYLFWWPWLRGYSGEISIGYFNRLAWAPYIWYDEDLKQSMGY